MHSAAGSSLTTSCFSFLCWWKKKGASHTTSTSVINVCVCGGGGHFESSLGKLGPSSFSILLRYLKYDTQYCTTRGTLTGLVLGVSWFSSRLDRGILRTRNFGRICSRIHTISDKWLDLKWSFWRIMSFKKIAIYVKGESCLALRLGLACNFQNQFRRCT